MDAEAADAVKVLRLKLRAARALIRDLAAATARCEDALAKLENAQPKEAQRDDQDEDCYCAAA